MGFEKGMKVLIAPSVRRWFDELETVLYDKGYFSFEDSSHRYADDLLRDIIARLPNRLHRPAPRHFVTYGKGLLQFATFRKSRRTVWYVFFTKHENTDGETVFIVRHIDNNHKIAKLI